MRKAYRNIGYYFLAILVVILIGSYANHLVDVMGSPVLPGFTGLHLMALLLWFALLIIQPFLIRQKRSKLHRMVGNGVHILSCLCW